MCGIFAYLGKKDYAPNFVIEGLKKLEYRGYDSWGVAYDEQKKLGVYRQVGKISDHNSDTKKFPKSTMALGHSRWATHGGVTIENAHPHTNNDS